MASMAASPATGPVLGHGGMRDGDCGSQAWQKAGALAAVCCSDGMFWTCLLSPSDLMCPLRPVFPYSLSTWMILLMKVGY